MPSFLSVAYIWVQVFHPDISGYIALLQSMLLLQISNAATAARLVADENGIAPASVLLPVLHLQDNSVSPIL